MERGTKEIQNRKWANEFLRQQKRLHTCRRKRLRFSFARNKDGIFGVILSRFRSTKTEKTRKSVDMKNIFQKKGKKRAFLTIYI